MNDNNKLADFLSSQEIPFTREENSIIVNGCRITFIFDEYLIRSLNTGDRLTLEPLYSPIETVDCLFMLSEALPGRIEYIISNPFYYKQRAKRFLSSYVELNCRDRIAQIITAAKFGNCTVEESAASIIAAVTNKETTITIYPGENDLFPYFGQQYILPIPLSPADLINGKVSVIDFVIIETLVSCPNLIPYCLKVASGKSFTMFPVQLRKLMKQKHKGTPLRWRRRILKSSLKLIVYKLILSLLAEERNYSFIRTNNIEIWTQIACLYGIEKIDFPTLPKEFVEKLKGFSLTKF